MATVQDKIKALGLTKVNKAGGKRVSKRRNKTALEQRIASMLQEGKPVPKHLAKKAEKIIEHMKSQMPKSVEAEVEPLPDFDAQPEAQSLNQDDNDDIPDFDLEEIDEVPDLVDVPSTIEDITNDNDKIVVL